MQPYLLFWTAALTFPSIDVSDFSDEPFFDYPVSVRYELFVLCCPLDVLDKLDEPRCPPGTQKYGETIVTLPAAFQVATVVRSNSPFELTDLDTLVDWTPNDERSPARVSPCLVWVQGNRFTIKDLTTKVVCSFTLGEVPGEVGEEVRLFTLFIYSRDLF
jgi:hypothetical protein